MRVLVVDDSAFFRRRISDILNGSPDLEVVGSAGNGMEAIREVQRLKPDVVTMDVEMPIMDGITAVRRIMSVAPTPILMFSSLTYEGARSTLDALDAGALDFLPKHYEDMAQGTGSAIKRTLCERVLAVGRTGVPGRADAPGPSRKFLHSTPAAGVKPRAVPDCSGRLKLVAIGASTGGPVALQRVLSALPADFSVPLVLAVHMPGSFTKAYADRLNGLCKIRVREARDGDPLEPGLALVAPGGKQLLMERRGNGAVARVIESPPDQTYRPSVDVLLGSAARLYPGDVLGIVLTGMGADGKQGAKLLKSTGSHVWSQNEESCVVYGMPQAVEKAGLSDNIYSLEEMGIALERCA